MRKTMVGAALAALLVAASIGSSFAQGSGGSGGSAGGAAGSGAAGAGASGAGSGGGGAAGGGGPVNSDRGGQGANSAPGARNTFTPRSDDLTRAR